MVSNVIIVMQKLTTLFVDMVSIYDVTELART